MTTRRPWLARMRGANSDPRYASRLNRPLTAKSAMAGGGPAGECGFRLWGEMGGGVRTVLLLEEVRDEEGFVCVVEGGDGEVELVR